MIRLTFPFSFFGLHFEDDVEQCSVSRLICKSSAFFLSRITGFSISKAAFATSSSVSLSYLLGNSVREIQLERELERDRDREWDLEFERELRLRELEVDLEERLARTLEGEFERKGGRDVESWDARLGESKCKSI